MDNLAARLHRHVPALAALLLGLVVTGPLMARGFVLAYDMVFVPNPRLSLALLGLSRTLPRSVPTGFVVASASKLLTGQVVQKLILIGIFAGAAYGAARLVPARRTSARVAAGMLYAWNPFLYERLLFGHWTLLLAYAAMPWVAGAALEYRRGVPRAWARLALALAAAVATGPYGGLFGAVVAMAIALFPPGGLKGRRGAAVVAMAVAINLPWLVPGLLHQPVPGQPALALELFRARSDSSLGLMGSLVSLGGLWRTDLAPPGRHGLAWIPAFCLIAVVSLWGWRELRTRLPVGAVRGLATLAALGLIAAIAPSVHLVAPLVRWASRALPGGAIFRDSQKYVIPLALFESVAFGAGVERILGRVRSDERAALGAALLLPLLPLALAPTLAWGAGGRLSPVSYPPSWEQAEAVMARDSVPGAVLAFPWHAYLPFGWNHDRTVRQPAAQYFSRPVVADSSLQVGPYRLPAEDPWSRMSTGVVVGRGPLETALARLGVRYVLLYKEADWRPRLPRLAGLRVVLETHDLVLYQAPPPVRVPTFAEPPIVAVLAADAVALALVLGAGAALMGARRPAGGPVILQPGDHHGVRSVGE